LGNERIFKQTMMRLVKQRNEDLRVETEKEHNRPITVEEVIQAYQLVELLAVNQEKTCMPAKKY